MSTKRKSALPLSKRDPAFYHWKQEADIMEYECQYLQKLQYQLATDIQRMKLKHETELALLSEQLVDTDNALPNAQKRLKSAKARYKDPLFENLSKMFPLTILQLLSDYNACAICSECNGYFPKALSICHPKGHQFHVRYAELSIENNTCVWTRQDLQEIWNDALSMVTNQIRIAKQTKFTRHITIVNMLTISLQPQSVTLYHSFGQRIVYFKLSNTLKRRKQQ